MQCLLVSEIPTRSVSKVNRQIAENSVLTKCRKSTYTILPKFFSKNYVLVQNAEIFFSHKTNCFEMKMLYEKAHNFKCT